MTRVTALSLDGGGYVRYLELDLAEQAYWHGVAADLLGLEGREATAREMKELCRGIDPSGGEQLRRKQTNRTDEQGEVIARSRTLYDMVVAAPKSASIVAVFDDRIISAHREAVAHVMKEAESLAAIHDRTNGQSNTLPTRNLALAPYEHRTSRLLDPHLHTHVVVPNLTYNAEQERWQALRAGPIYRNRHELSELYRDELAARLESYGYDLDARIVRRERYQEEALDGPRQVGFEIAGVPKEICDKFSQRSWQRDQEISAFEERHGRYPTEAEISRLVQQIRGPGEKESAKHPLQEIARLSDREHAQLEALVGHALERSEKLAPWVAPELRRDLKPELRQPEQRTHPKLSLDDSPHFEPGLKREDWEYGEGYRKRGQRMGP